MEPVDCLGGRRGEETMGWLATPGQGRGGPHPSRRMAPLCGSYGNLDTYKSVCDLNSLIVTTNIPDGG